MGIWNAAGDAANEIKEKQAVQEKVDAAKAEAEEQAKKDQQQHEENKKQGML